MLSLHQLNCSIAVHCPQDGYYCGTRFDRSGIFASLQFRGTEFAQQWFTQYDPFMHDAVCGPVEEYSPILLSPERVLKIGVGLLGKQAREAYDRFHLYPVLDAGHWEVQAHKDAIVFLHILDGYYRYQKTLSLPGDGLLRLDHQLLCTGDTPLVGDVYNHNFFTFGRLATDPARRIDFGFQPVGQWRAPYESVKLSGNGLRFQRALQDGETVFMGNIHSDTDATPYDLTLSDQKAGHSIHISGSQTLSRAVFWANHRIACIEPYIDFSIAPGHSFHFQIDYQLL